MFNHLTLRHFQAAFIAASSPLYQCLVTVAPSDAVRRSAAATGKFSAEFSGDLTTIRITLSRSIKPTRLHRERLRDCLRPIETCQDDKLALMTPPKQQI